MHTLHMPFLLSKNFVIVCLDQLVHFYVLEVDEFLK